MTPCKFFARGHCSFGASCRNSHQARSNTQSLDLPSGKKLDNNGKETKSTCWFFSNGGCTYGATCRNGHDIVGIIEAKNRINIYIGFFFLIILNIFNKNIFLLY
jgi:hypothetical protein